MPVTQVQRKTRLLLQFTSMCSSTLQGVDCPYGRRCKFAHSSEELRAKPDLRGTSMCSRFIAGKCRAGEHCRFSHAVPDEHYSFQSSLEEELSPVETPASSLQWNYTCTPPLPPPGLCLPPSFQGMVLPRSQEVFVTGQECNRWRDYVASFDHQFDEKMDVHMSSFVGDVPFQEDGGREPTATPFRNNGQDWIAGPFSPLQDEVTQPVILMRMSL
eukprot:TRINITY_DN12207_c0_g1_i3.p1 TRINITY_DN12207_c0_g1~~TRINITY_DN12207_c0_g1_i3.p1  ORF type:complete len:215 (-),score=21.37 TRINITY_DN12207_c0_g1_i3:154-798(-)